MTPSLAFAGLKDFIDTTLAGAPSRGKNKQNQPTGITPSGAISGKKRATGRSMAASDRQSTFSGTKEVAERLRFDVGLLEAYLRAHVQGFAGPVSVQQFKGGQS